MTWLSPSARLQPTEALVSHYLAIAGPRLGDDRLVSRTCRWACATSLRLECGSLVLACHDTAVELELEAVRLSITFTVLMHVEALRTSEEAAPACLQATGLQKSAVCKERATSGCDVCQDPVPTANQTSSPQELQKDASSCARV